MAPPTQGTWRSNDYVNALRLMDGYFFYGVSGRQNIYGTWITNTTVGYHKHARPPCSIVFRYHIPTSHSQQYNPNDSWLNTSRHWQLFLKVGRCPYSPIPHLPISCFTRFTHSVLLRLIRFRLHDLVSSSMSFFNTKPICHCIQFSC